jgi:hypothetical protein
MNETQFLRKQLALEHQHLQSVVRMTHAALASAAEGTAPDEFLRTCADYLMHAVRLLEARDRGRLELHYARHGRTDQDSDRPARDLERAIDEAKPHWQNVEAALGTGAPLVPALHRPIKLLGNWLMKRAAAAQTLDDGSYSVEEWRRTSFVNAGSIFDERNRYNRVEAARPIGINRDHLDGVEVTERHGR